MAAWGGWVSRQAAARPARRPLLPLMLKQTRQGRQAGTLLPAYRGGPGCPSALQARAHTAGSAAAASVRSVTGHACAEQQQCPTTTTTTSASGLRAPLLTESGPCSIRNRARTQSGLQQTRNCTTDSATSAPPAGQQAGALPCASKPAQQLNPPSSITHRSQRCSRRPGTAAPPRCSRPCSRTG